MDSTQPLVLSGSILIDEAGKICLLHRIKHNHYETPGGKVDSDDAHDILNPSISELEVTARRELAEEVAHTIDIVSMEYFTSVPFTIPDGRKAIAYKFIVHVKGIVAVNVAEGTLFDKVGNFLVDELDDVKLSPDLELILPQLQKKLSHH